MIVSIFFILVKIKHIQNINFNNVCIIIQNMLYNAVHGKYVSYNKRRMILKTETILCVNPSAVVEQICSELGVNFQLNVYIGLL